MVVICFMQVSYIHLISYNQHNNIICICAGGSGIGSYRLSGNIGGHKIWQFGRNLTQCIIGGIKILRFARMSVDNVKIWHCIYPSTPFLY